jgi:hypothetical protein
MATTTIERETKTYTVSHSVAPHSIVIKRTSALSSGGSTSSQSRKATTGVSDDLPFTKGDYALVTITGVSAVKTSSDQEKKELQNLNERFSNYLDKVKIIRKLFR